MKNPITVYTGQSGRPGEKGNVEDVILVAGQGLGFRLPGEGEEKEFTELGADGYMLACAVDGDSIGVAAQGQRHVCHVILVATGP